MSIRAEGTYGKNTINTEEVKFTIYTGSFIRQNPLLKKNYIYLVSVSVNARKAQACQNIVRPYRLETGWDKSNVDKYDGRFSYNFGIKVKEQWHSNLQHMEEYNGVAFRIDELSIQQ